MHLSLLYVYVVPDDNISSWIYLAVTSNSGHLIKICQIKLFTIIFSLMWIPSRNMFIIVYICFIFSEFFAFLCALFYTILLYNSILYCFISNGGIFYALFWVICGRIMTIISSPGAMLLKIDTNQSIFQCHKWITEIIIIYYIKLQYLFILHIVVIQSLSHVQFFVTPWTAACPAPQSSTVSQFAQSHVHWVRCHATISSSVVHFFCLQSFPALGSFPMSWPFASGGQNIGASVSASALPMNIQGWFTLELTGLISL